MRIETGFLRSSFQVSINAPILNLYDNPNPDADAEVFDLEIGPISLAIAQASLGDTIYGVFTANYAIHREYGTKFQSADAFVMTNVAIWPDYVEEAVSIVRTAVNGD